MIFRPALIASMALLLSSTPTVLAGAATSDELNVKPRNLEERTSSAAKVITTCTQSGTFALTFDDGPWTYGSKIAQNIASHGGHTTFFVNGNNWGCIYDFADDLIARYNAGHQIASHTWTHVDITTISTSEFETQLTLVETALQKILGVKPRYFRPPYGSYNTANLKVLKARGYQVVTWDFDSGDSDGASTTQSINSYGSLLKGKNTKYPHPHIALNHETYSGTGNVIIPKVVPQLIKAGYKLVTVDQCLGGSGAYQSVGTPGKRDSTWTCAGTPQPGPDRLRE